MYLDEHFREFCSLKKKIIGIKIWKRKRMHTGSDILSISTVPS
jgi:hypothetical protein